MKKFIYFYKNLILKHSPIRNYSFLGLSDVSSSPNDSPNSLVRVLSIGYNLYIILNHLNINCVDKKTNNILPSLIKIHYKYQIIS